MRHIPPLLLAAAMAMGLAGCNGVPVSTMWKLRGFKFVDADLTKLRGAVRTPAWLTTTPEKALGEAQGATLEGEAEAPKHPVHLQSVRNAADAAALGAQNAVVFEIATRDIASLRALQETAKKNEAAGAEVAQKGALRFTANLACRNGEIPATGPIPVDLWFHPNDDIGWTPVWEGYDVRPMLEQAQKEKPGSIDEVVPPCDKRAPKAEAAKGAARQ
jgi:hypothetical protein